MQKRDRGTSLWDDEARDEHGSFSDARVAEGGWRNESHRALLQLKTGAEDLRSWRADQSSGIKPCFDRLASKKIREKVRMKDVNKVS